MTLVLPLKKSSSNGFLVVHHERDFHSLPPMSSLVFCASGIDQVLIYLRQFSLTDLCFAFGIQSILLQKKTGRVAGSGAV